MAPSMAVRIPALEWQGIYMEGSSMTSRGFTKKALVLIAVLLVGGLLAGLAVVQAQSSSISLDSPVSFPVDI
jgi:hypothetical protein